MKNNERVYKMSFASVYPLYVAKAEKKGRTKEEVDTVICWLTGYNQKQLEEQITKETNFEDFFAIAPQKTPTELKLLGLFVVFA